MQGWSNIHKSLNIIQNIIRTKDKNHLGICRKSLRRNSASIHDKSSDELVIEGMYLNIIKAVYVCI
jgi:hypothetical protein